jgi:transposase
VPKPSHLRSVDPTPAPAAQGVAPCPSGVSAKAMPNPSELRSVDPTPAQASPDATARPSGVAVEVEPKPGRRRSFTAAEKLRIVREAAACTKRGDVEALLRREGIYSSLLAAWRKQIGLHGSEALAGRKPGRKPKHDAKDLRIAELEKRAARLEAKLSLAEKLIELQKKVSAILGINLSNDGES